MTILGVDVTRIEMTVNAHTRMLLVMTSCQPVMVPLVHALQLHSSFHPIPFPALFNSPNNHQLCDGERLAIYSTGFRTEEC
jgi:hypothetical protein